MVNTSLRYTSSLLKAYSAEQQTDLATALAQNGKLIMSAFRGDAVWLWDVATSTRFRATSLFHRHQQTMAANSGLEEIIDILDSGSNLNPDE